MKGKKPIGGFVKDEEWCGMVGGTLRFKYGCRKPTRHNTFESYRECTSVRANFNSKCRQLFVLFARRNSHRVEMLRSAWVADTSSTKAASSKFTGKRGVGTAIATSAVRLWERANAFSSIWSRARSQGRVKKPSRHWKPS